MLDALTLTIGIIGAVFVGLTAVIVINKAWRESRERRRRARRAVLEPMILDWVHGTDPSLSNKLSGTMRSGDDEVVETVLLDYAQRVRGIERDRLSSALEEMGYVATFLDRLQHRNWWHRAAAAEKLGISAATRATDALAAALSDEVSEVRIRAAKALGVLGGEASVRPLTLALNEPNRWSTIRIADILTSMGRQVVDELLEVWPELTPHGKRAALDVLGRIRPLKIQPWLYERLADEDPDVRARACHTLGAIGDPNSGERVEALLGDEAWPVRAMAAKALGRMRFDSSIPALCGALRDQAWWTRSNAAESLRKMGNRGVRALDRMLEDEDTYARHQAVQMLEQAGLVDQQVDLLAHAGPESEAAAEMLRRLIQAGPTSRLGELLEQHPDSQVRAALRGLLEQEAGAS